MDLSAVTIGPGVVAVLHALLREHRLDGQQLAWITRQDRMLVAQHVFALHQAGLVLADADTVALTGDGRAVARCVYVDAGGAVRWMPGTEPLPGSGVRVSDIGTGA